MPIKVRGAIDLDIIQLIQIAKDYSEEAMRWGNLTFDTQRAVYYAVQAMRDKDQQIFVATDGRQIVGFMWAAIQAHVWTADRVASDLVLYVSPEHRNATVACGLVGAFEEWAKACGAKAIHVGANSGIFQDKAASALYTHLGYEPGGANFYKQLNTEEG